MMTTAAMALFYLLHLICRSESRTKTSTYFERTVLILPSLPSNDHKEYSG